MQAKKIFLSGLSLIILWFSGLYNPTYCQTPALEKKYQEAIQFFNDEKTEKGFALLDQILAEAPNYEEARFARSYYAMQQEDYLDALQDYHYLILQNPEDAQNYLYRGQAYLMLEMLAEAEEDYLLAYQLDSTQIDISNALGSLYFFMGLHQDAQYYLNKSIQQQAKDPIAYYYKAYSHFEQQDFESAFNSISQYLTLTNNELDGQRLKAMILIAQNKPSSAIAIFDALERQDDIIFEEEDFFYWAKAYYLQKKYEEAKFYLELPENPSYLPIYYYLGKIHYHLNQSEKSLQLLSKVIQVWQDAEPEEIAPVYYDRAIVHSKQNKPQVALQDFLQALYLMPELAQQKNHKGTAIPLLGNALVMLKLDTTSQQIDSVLVKGYQARAERLIALGDSNKALVACQMALSIAPNNAKSLTLRAIAQLIKRNFVDALQDLETAQKSTVPQDLQEVFYVKALLYRAQNQADSVAKYLDKALALEIGKTKPEIFQEKAYWLAEKGDFEQAIQYIDRALKLEADNLDFLNERATYYLKAMKYQACIDDCNQVLVKNPRDPQALYQRGLAYKGLERYQEAYNDFEEILLLYPNEEEILILALEMEKKIKP